jgi:hypothetical protein
MKYPLQQLGKTQYQRAYRMFYAAKRQSNNVYFQQVHSLSSYFRYKKDMVVNKHKLKRETRYPFVTQLIANAYFYNEHKLYFSTKHPTRIKMRPSFYNTARRKP